MTFSLETYSSKPPHNTLCYTQQLPKRLCPDNCQGLWERRARDYPHSDGDSAGTQVATVFYLDLFPSEILLLYAFIHMSHMHILHDWKAALGHSVTSNQTYAYVGISDCHSQSPLPQTKKQADIEKHKPSLFKGPHISSYLLFFLILFKVLWIATWESKI